MIAENKPTRVKDLQEVVAEVFSRGVIEGEEHQVMIGNVETKVTFRDGTITLRT